MNATGQDAGEYGEFPETLFEGDGVPSTLKALLRFIAEDYVPEVAAYVAFANEWLAQRPDLKAGSSGLDRIQDRSIGEVDFLWRGHSARVAVMPYRLYLLQKVQDVFDAASPEAQAKMEALMSETDLLSLLHLRTTRRVERQNHLEVWSAPR
jgi:hypothetical protein